MMNLRTKYILFIVIIHVILLALSFYILRSNQLLFILSEAFILVSIFFSRKLYLELIAPLQLLLTGIDAIKDQDFNVKFLKTGKKEMDQLIEVYNMMIDQLRKERIQQEQQHYFLDKLIQTSPSGIVILDFDENISNMNPKASELLEINLKEITGKPISELGHPIFKAISTLKSGESKMVAPNGNQIFKCHKSHFIDRGFAHHFVVIEEFTQEILTAEKKAYGKIIRMMAHEVNNSIGAVNSILDTTLHLEHKDSEIAEGLQIAIQRNDHLNHFMKKLADVVRLTAAHLEKVNLNELIENVIRLMQYKAQQAGIEIRSEGCYAPVYIIADVHQMEQVLINIIKNSIESIEEKNSDQPRFIKCTISDYPKQLSIVDNGQGIEKEIESQLFTPFFTTKREGQGIGLTLIREILMNHGYWYSLMSSADGMTTFTIKFTEKS